MLYFLIRPLVRIAFRIYFSKIHLHHLERIPRDRAVLISSNHPSAFLEACLLATHFPKSLNFLVRGDIFKGEFVKKILSQLHLIPIYRTHDGFKSLRANESTFNICYDLLSKKEIVVVYSEGNTKQEKRLRPIQKGLARIAYGAMDKYPDLDLCIVPMGINHTKFNTFRSEMYVEVGEPIELKEFYANYKQDSIKAIADLTQLVEDKMRPLVIHINEDLDLDLNEKLFDLNKARTDDSFLPVVETDGKRFALDKSTSDKINLLKEDQKKSLDGMIKPVSHKFNIAFQILAFPGTILNYLPFRLAKFISDRVVSRVEFYASINLGSGLFLYLFYLIFIGLIGKWIGFGFWLTILLAMVSGFITLYARHLMMKDSLRKYGAANAGITI